MFSAAINLAIVDDHVLFRKTLANFLSEQKNVCIPIQESDMPALLSKLRECSIDILILDLFLPGMHGTDAIKVLRTEYPGIKILVLSMSIDIDLICNMLDSGIHAYISKSDEPEQLLEALRNAACNRLFRNKWFTEALYRNRQRNIEANRPNVANSLNGREKRILQLIWDEKSNKEIADELFLGIRSIEKIRQNIKEKIGAKSMIGLLKYAIDRRIIEIANFGIDQAIQPLIADQTHPDQANYLSNLNLP